LQQNNGQEVVTLAATYDVGGNLKSSADADNNHVAYTYL